MSNYHINLTIAAVVSKAEVVVGHDTEAVHVGHSAGVVEWNINVGHLVIVLVINFGEVAVALGVSHVAGSVVNRSNVRLGVVSDNVVELAVEIFYVESCTVAVVDAFVFDVETVVDNRVRAFSVVAFTENVETEHVLVSVFVGVFVGQSQTLFHRVSACAFADEACGIGSIVLNNLCASAVVYVNRGFCHTWAEDIVHIHHHLVGGSVTFEERA